MLLYLARHGKAEDNEVDAARRLTHKGVADVRKMAEFLKSLAIAVGEVWHSDKQRAVQTAELLAAQITVTGQVREVAGLHPNDASAPIRAAIAGAGGDLLIVGHLPFLSKLGSALLSGNNGDDFLTLPTAAIACLKGDADGPWRLAWLVNPDILP